MYDDVELPVRPALVAAHKHGWQQLFAAGAFWDNQSRAAIVLETLAAPECEYCLALLDELSPYALEGEHTTVTSLLAAPLVDAIHRIAIDPGRLTKRVHENVLNAGFSNEQYVELVSVVCTTVIIATLHRALGSSLPTESIPDVRAGEIGQPKADVVGGEAWVPIAPSDPELNELNIPKSANIVRSMGAVPAAVLVFFGVFRPAYTITDVPGELTRVEAELIAARVSALNQCFY